LRFTDRTLVRQRDFLAQLDEVQTRGYAMDKNKNEIGGRCVTVAVPKVKLPLAISVSAPKTRLTAASVPKVATRLKHMTERLAADLTGGAAPG
jgi:DNA-binding IclR family transcriptional regulator